LPAALIWPLAAITSRVRDGPPAARRGG